MSAKFGIPYRAPCGGWPAHQVWFIGGMYQHWRPDEAEIAQFDNVTQVTDWHIPAGAPIDPYPRLMSREDIPGSITGGNCPGLDHDEDCPHGGSAVPGTVGCGMWRNKGRLYPPDGAQCGDKASDWNCWSESGTVNEAVCRKKGFKAAQSRKSWHGRHGFLSHDPGGCARAPVDFTGCHTCMIEDEQPTPDTTKYLGLVARFDWWSYVLTDPEGETSCPPATTKKTMWSREISVVIDQYSGVQTMRGCTAYNDPELSIPTGQFWLAANVACDSISVQPAEGDPYMRFPFNTSGKGRDFGGFPDDQRDFVCVGTNTEASLTMQTTAPCYVGGEEISWPVQELKVSFKLDTPYTSAQCRQDGWDLLGLMPLNDDKLYPWRTDGHVAVAPLITRNEVGATAPWTVVITQHEDGTTNRTSIGCTVDDYSQPQNPDGSWPQKPWEDSNAPYYDGRIIGAPLPAGYRGQFNWDHRTYRACVDEDGDFTPYVYAWGARSNQPNVGDNTDWVVPACATQWTENFPEPGRKPIGPWQFYENGQVYCQKWAEINVRRPSHNMARPSGPDRYLIDEPRVQCAWMDDGKLACGSELGVADGAKVIIAGVDGFSTGVYTVARATGTPVRYNATFVESTPGLPDYNPGSGIVAPLRFLSAPGIRGRVSVKTATQTEADIVQIETAEPTWLKTSDHVDFTAVSGMGSDLPVTVIDTTHFTVHGTLSPYDGKGWVSCHGAPAYYFDDATPKGDYVRFEWRFNRREVEERDRVILQAANCDCPEVTVADPTPIRAQQGAHGMSRDVCYFYAIRECYQVNPCCPAVVCYSPNGETWANGVTHGFYPIDLDDRYGARWQAMVLQHMPDPLWQAPHNVCVECDDELLGPVYQTQICHHVEDPGTCESGICLEPCIAVEGTEIQSTYYAQRPWVEALSDTPGGYGPGQNETPTLPAGLTFHYLTLSELAMATPPDGIVMNPPDGSGYPTPDAYSAAQPNEWQTAWTIYVREEICVRNGGEFAAEYIANGVDAPGFSKSSFGGAPVEKIGSVEEMGPIG